MENCFLQKNSLSLLLFLQEKFKNRQDNSENLATPVKAISQKKFEAMIKHADEGGLITV